MFLFFRKNSKYFCRKGCLVLVVLVASESCSATSYFDRLTSPLLKALKAAQKYRDAHTEDPLEPVFQELLSWAGNASAMLEDVGLTKLKKLSDSGMDILTSVHNLYSKLKVVNDKHNNKTEGSRAFDGKLVTTKSNPLLDKIIKLLKQTSFFANLQAMLESVKKVSTDETFQKIMESLKDSSGNRVRINSAERALHLDGNKFHAHGAAGHIIGDQYPHVIIEKPSYVGGQGVPPTTGAAGHIIGDQYPHVIIDKPSYVGGQGVPPTTKLPRKNEHTLNRKTGWNANVPPRTGKQQEKRNVEGIAGRLKSNVPPHRRFKRNQVSRIMAQRGRTQANEKNSTIPVKKEVGKFRKNHSWDTRTRGHYVRSTHG